MEIPINFQLREAGLALMLGISSGLIYDVFRTIRHQLRWNAVTFLSDTLFWLMCAAALFSLGLSAGGGKQRLFVLILAFIGGLLYFFTVSQFVMRILSLLAGVICILIHWAIRPLVWMWKLLIKSALFIKKGFSSRLKWYKISHIQKNASRSDVRTGALGGDLLEIQKSRYVYEAYPGGTADLRNNLLDSPSREDRGCPRRTVTVGNASGVRHRGQRRNAVRHRKQQR